MTNTAFAKQFERRSQMLNIRCRSCKGRMKMSASRDAIALLVKGVKPGSECAIAHVGAPH